MALQTTVERVDGRVPITVLALDGELDASNYERLIEEVRGLYAAGDRNLLLDLSARGAPRTGSWRCTPSFS